MCLIALAIDQSRRFPLVLAANRDEFFSRPTARLGWWQPPDGPPVLSGRDLLHGGTWLGLTTQGRLALVTNVRRPGLPDPEAPSRGRIVLDWLAHRESADRFWMRTALSGFNGFNLIALDFKDSHCFWASNLTTHPMRLGSGLVGLSNGLLNEPEWPKVGQLKARVAHALQHSPPDASVDNLADQLFAALSDRSLAADDELPETGLPPARERELSAAFIRTADGLYGTRCSTVVVTERIHRRLVTHVWERSFVAPPGSVALVRRSQLKHWPPRHTDPAAEPEAVSEAEAGELPPLAAPSLPAKRTRMRRLLRHH